MKISSLLVIILFFIIGENCVAMEIIVYNKGLSDKIEFTKTQEEKIIEIVKDIYEKADKVLSFNITKENLKEIKNKDRCVEVIFDVSYPFANGTIGYSVVRKMLIPISGKYSGDFKKGSLNFFAGADEYDGKSYSNSDGLKYIEQIYKVLQR